MILQDISCAFPAGEVSCIMGPSGAGKSSLLSVLARRSDGGLLSNFVLAGDILLNGNPLDGESSGSIAFVAQDDSHHLPALTVRFLALSVNSNSDSYYSGARNSSLRRFSPIANASSSASRSSGSSDPNARIEALCGSPRRRRIAQGDQWRREATVDARRSAAF